MKRRSRNGEDKLSDLSDPIILRILSFLNTKNAFQTCILSTRWKNLAKYVPTLRLSTNHFKSFNSFNNSVSTVLSLRDDSTALHTVDFTYTNFVTPHILKKIIQYAVSHHVQLLRLCIACDIQIFSSCIFSSQTLTSLDLSVHVQHKTIFYSGSLKNLPALTSLTLKYFHFGPNDDGCAEPFSTLNKLNSLTITNCKLLNTQILCISSTTLVNLTIYRDYYHYKFKFKIKLSAPSLCNFSFSGAARQKLFVSRPCSIKHFYVDVKDIGTYHPIEEDSTILLSWLAELANIKSLTVSSNTLQVLSSIPDLFKVKLTSLWNLETLQVKMKPLTYRLYKILLSHTKFRKELDDKFYSNLDAFIPDGVLKFFIQNSPSAKVNIYIPFHDLRTKSTQELKLKLDVGVLQKRQNG